MTLSKDHLNSLYSILASCVNDYRGSVSRLDRFSKNHLYGYEARDMGKIIDQLNEATKNIEHVYGVIETEHSDTQG